MISNMKLFLKEPETFPETFHVYGCTREEDQQNENRNMQYFTNKQSK